MKGKFYCILLFNVISDEKGICMRKKIKELYDLLPCQILHIVFLLLIYPLSSVFSLLATYQNTNCCYVMQILVNVLLFFIFLASNYLSERMVTNVMLQ